MRLDALHHYTAALPAIDPDSDVPPTGLCTATAMQAGAYWGAIYEIKGYISRYTRTYPALLTLILEAMPLSYSTGFPICPI